MLENIETYNRIGVYFNKDIYYNKDYSPLTDYKDSGYNHFIITEHTDPNIKHFELIILDSITHDNVTDFLIRFEQTNKCFWCYNFTKNDYFIIQKAFNSMDGLNWR